MTDFRRQEEDRRAAAERRVIGCVTVALWACVALLMWWSP